MRVRFPYFFLIVSLLVPVGFSHAQIANVADPFNIQINPEFPRPYDTISITPQSTVIDLAATQITYSVNDVVIGQGSGSAGIRYTVGAAGTTYVIKLTALTNGKTYSKEMTVIPGDVALILEPVSSAPALYEGGALVAPEGRMRIVAVPNIRSKTGLIPSDKLSYTWRLGDRVLQAESGIGRSVLNATAPLRYRNAVVSVTVTTLDGEITAHTSTSIAPSDPVVRIYRNDPLLGLDLSKAITGSYALVGEEETFRAVSYFFASSPSFAWSLNSNPAGVDEDLTVRTEGTKAGTAVVGLSSLSGKQSATSAFTVSFSGKKAGSLFGL